MTLRMPLEVRLKSGRTDRIITADLADLTFRAVDPGGYASASAAFAHPLRVAPDDLDYYSNLYVYDARRGSVVWEGWVEDLGGAADENGEVWHFAAIGPSAHVKDRQFPYIVVESGLDKFTPTSTNQWNVTWQGGAEDEATGAPSIVANLSNGSWVLAGIVAETMYRQVYDAGQKLARVRVGWDSGMAATLDWQVAIYAWTDPATAGGNVASDFVDDVGGVLTATLTGDGGSITLGKTAVSLTAAWNGPTNYVNPGTGEALWWSFDSFALRTVQYTKAGAEITSGYSTTNVYADEVVADLLGRGILDLYDGAGAAIDAGTVAIGQLAYPDVTTAETVFKDLMLFEPGMTWHAWESNSAGKYRFEWVAYSASVGYDASIVDGWTPEDTVADAFNAVRVRYRTVTGAIRTVRRTASVPVLTAAGRTREALLDLGDEAALTATQAEQAGDTWLESHGLPANAGRLRIARPILDVGAGRMVDPWELTNGVGRLIRVAGVAPRVDALNATARDGLAVFRIVSVEVSADDASAVLELDVYSALTVSALAGYAAALASRQRRR